MIVMVFGVFDLIHSGHINFLRQAKRYGDYLTVCVLDDKYCAEYKRKPILSEADRYIIVKNLKIVDEIMLCIGDFETIMKLYSPDIVVHGDDDKNAKSIQTAKKLGIKTKIIPYTKRISTTEIIKRCKNAKT